MGLLQVGAADLDINRRGQTEIQYRIDQAAGLEPADLEKLAAASWWAGHPDESTVALERAFAAHASADTQRSWTKASHAR